MTTLVTTRQPLQVLSMSSNSKKRGRDNRASSYDEADGDFQFTRSKKAKPSKPEPIPEEEPVLQVTEIKKNGRTARTTKTQKALPPSPSPPPQPAKSLAKRTSKRKSNRITQDEEPEPVPVREPSPPAMRKPAKNERRKAARALPEDEDEDEEIRPARKPNGRGRKPPPPPPEELIDDRADEEDQVDVVDMDRTPTPPRATVPKGKKGTKTQQITLPFADTPVQNRNKEMRKEKAAGGQRRDSLSSRGRRASSLIENGNNALPHRAVDTAQFYKHVSSEGLTEPRRMKQLLTWCAERALTEKPPLGSSNANVVHGARAIQDQLLKDFSSKSEFSDWFAREEVPRPPPIVKPNPRNQEHDEKIAELEERLQKLRAEKKTWQAIRAAPVDQAPLFPSTPEEHGDSTSLSPRRQQKTQTLPLPESSLLDPEESKMLDSLITTSSKIMSTSQVSSRLQILQQSLEFRIDHLADSVHKVEQRVLTAGRQADRVLSLSAARLKERADRERSSAGTREMPVMEVLRSLGRILPEEG